MSTSTYAWSVTSSCSVCQLCYIGWIYISFQAPAKLRRRNRLTSWLSVREVTYSCVAGANYGLTFWSPYSIEIWAYIFQLLSALHLRLSWTWSFSQVLSMFSLLIPFLFHILEDISESSISLFHNKNPLTIPCSVHVSFYTEELRTAIIIQPRIALNSLCTSRFLQIKKPVTQGYSPQIKSKWSLLKTKLTNLKTWRYQTGTYIDLAPVISSNFGIGNYFLWYELWSMNIIPARTTIYNSVLPV